MSYAEQLYESLKTEEDIRSLVGTEENLHLEVKTGSSPLTDDDKGYLSQALSGFANSDGGILVFGMKTERQSPESADVVTEARPIQAPKKVVTEINALIGQIVSPIVNGVLAKTVPASNSKGMDYGYIVVLIPASDLAPHRALSKKIGAREYWKRSGDSFYRMEHYDIADMFGRRQRPKLKLNCRIIRGLEISVQGETLLGGRIVISIRNEGRSIARFPFLAVTILEGARWHNHGLDRRGGTGLKRVATSSSTGEVIYKGGTDVVIHPGEELEVDALEEFSISDRDPMEPQSVHIRYRLGAENHPFEENELELSGSRLLEEIRTIWNQ